jgi:hypothetical protein
MKINKIIRPAHTEQWSMIPTAIFKNNDVSMAAVGLYCWVYSQPPSAEISKDAILTHFKIGLSAFYGRVKELINCGFLVRENARNEGKFSGVNYLLLNEPFIDLPHTDLPYMEKPHTDNPHTYDLNRGIYNNIYNNNIYNNKTLDNNNINLDTNINLDNKVKPYLENIVNNILPRNEKTAFSDGTIKAFDHFVALFPDKYKPKSEAQKNKWLDCLDKVQRIDGYDLREVYLMVKKMRQDDFWQSNFLSILKLRNTDKNGVKYIDRFMDRQEDYLKSAKNKIQGIIRFYKYTTPSGQIVIGAKTKGGDLSHEIIEQKLTNQEIEKIKATL